MGTHVRKPTSRQPARPFAPPLDTAAIEQRAIVVGIKAALAARGICGPAVASSFEHFDDGQHRRVHDILAVLPAW